MNASAANSPSDPWVRGPVTEHQPYGLVPTFTDAFPGSAGHGPTDVPHLSTPVQPLVDDAAEKSVSWVGAHGGAGATTFAGALGGVDVGHAWPDVTEGHPGDMLLLARTHLSGLQAASKTLDALRTGKHPVGLNLLALVLVADAPGRLPVELWRRVRVMRSVVGTISVPWIAEWRVGRPASKAPRAVMQLAALIPKSSTAPEAHRKDASRREEVSRRERSAAPGHPVRPGGPTGPDQGAHGEPAVQLQPFVYPTPYSPQHVVPSVYSTPSTPPAPHPVHPAPTAGRAQHAPAPKDRR